MAKPTSYYKDLAADYSRPGLVSEQRRLVEERQVMKCIGIPEDIGHAAAFLASRGFFHHWCGAVCG